MAQQSKLVLLDEAVALNVDVGEAKSAHTQHQATQQDEHTLLQAVDQSSDDQLNAIKDENRDFHVAVRHALDVEHIEAVG